MGGKRDNALDVDRRPDGSSDRQSQPGEDSERHGKRVRDAVGNEAEDEGEEGEARAEEDRPEGSDRELGRVVRLEPTRRNAVGDTAKKSGSGVSV